MNIVRTIISKLSRRNKTDRCKPGENRNSDDPANVLYDALEHGCKCKEEKGFSICQMKHDNEL